MTGKKYRVTLTEREELAAVLARGSADVRKLKHAQVLLPDEAVLAADCGYANMAPIGVQASQCSGPLQDIPLATGLQPAPSYPQGPVVNAGSLYRRFARDLADGTSLALGFEVAVRRHRLLDAIERADAAGSRQADTPPGPPRVLRHADSACGRDYALRRCAEATRPPRSRPDSSLQRLPVCLAGPHLHRAAEPCRGDARRKRNRRIQRVRLEHHVPAHGPSRAHVGAGLGNFFAASGSGGLDALLRVLDADVALVVDPALRPRASR